MTLEFKQIEKNIIALKNSESTKSKILLGLPILLRVVKSGANKKTNRKQIKQCSFRNR